MSRRVGVFGGSFDPVHDGHLGVARRALEQVPCDELWFLPAARAVHKPGGASAPAGDRRAMLELVLADEPRLELCALELEAPRPLRSLESLRRLAADWPEHRWFFVLGEDSFRALDTWYRPDELFRIAAPVVAPRPGASGDRPDRSHGVAVRWLEGEEIDLDSTAIRRALASGADPPGLHPAVRTYIREHGLYRKQGA